MDGEWQDLDADECVKAACADEEMRAKWSRYHLVRDVIRNDDITLNSSLTSRISSAIADEPTYSNVSSINVAHKSRSNSVSATSAQANPSQLPAEPVKRRGSALAGFAVAACVALATLIGLNVWQGAPGTGSNVQTVAGIADNGLTTPAQATLPGVTLPEVEFVANRGTFWVTPESKRSPAVEKRLNALLSQHIEASPTAERTGMLPYSRLVGYDSVSPE